MAESLKIVIKSEYEMYKINAGPKNVFSIINRNETILLMSGYENICNLKNTESTCFASCLRPYFSKTHYWTITMINAMNETSPLLLFD